jgi:hypothetical protein
VVAVQQNAFSLASESGIGGRVSTRIRVNGAPVEASDCVAPRHAGGGVRRSTSRGGLG